MTINNYTLYPGSGPGLSRLMVSTDRRDVVVYLLCLKINKYQRDNLCRRFRSRFFVFREDFEKLLLRMQTSSLFVEPQDGSVR